MDTGPPPPHQRSCSMDSSLARSGSLVFARQRSIDSASSFADDQGPFLQLPTYPASSYPRDPPFAFPHRSMSLDSGSTSSPIRHRQGSTGGTKMQFDPVSQCSPSSVHILAPSTDQGSHQATCFPCPNTHWYDHGALNDVYVYPLFLSDLVEWPWFPFLCDLG